MKIFLMKLTTFILILMNPYLTYVAAKVRRQTFDGYSPLQWWFGTQCAREVEEHGLGETRSYFERRLEFQTAAQTAFVRADARQTLRMAQYARSRVLRNPTVGQLVR